MALTRASAAVIKTEELLGFRNKIINGAMEVAQRGNTFTNQATISSPNGPYTLDRWKNNRATDASGMTVSQSTDAPSGFINSMRLQRVSGNTGTQGMFIFHTLAREDSIPLAGKTVTLSFYAKAGANFSSPSNSISLNPSSTTTDGDTRVYLFSPSKFYTSQTFVLTTSWQRFRYTFTLDSDIKQFGFNIQTATLSGTAGVDDSFYFTGCQLEEGSVATPFERRPFGMELALCERYYQIISTPEHRFFASSTATSGVSISTEMFRTVMRGTPSVTTSGGASGSVNITLVRISDNTSSSQKFYAEGQDSRRLRFYSDGTTNGVIYLIAATPSLFCSAEL